MAVHVAVHTDRGRLILDVKTDRTNRGSDVIVSKEGYQLTSSIKFKKNER